MSMLSVFRLRRTAVAAGLFIAGTAVFAPRPAEAQADACPYGYFYSNGYCYPYSWYGPSYSDEASDSAIYLNGNRRGGRHDGMRGGFHSGDRR
jgi:hypothetical protein